MQSPKARRFVNIDWLLVAKLMDKATIVANRNAARRLAQAILLGGYNVRVVERENGSWLVFKGDSK